MINQNRKLVKQYEDSIIRREDRDVSNTSRLERFDILLHSILYKINVIQFETQDDSEQLNIVGKNTID